MAKIIVYTGAHGTGKTTAAMARYKKLTAKYPDKIVAFISEVARKCPYPINLDGSLAGQIWIFSRQVQEELGAMAQADYVVCDRSVVDPIAYTAALTNLKNAYFTAEKMLALAAGLVPHYDEINFMSIANNDYLKDDGVRDLNKEWRRHVEFTLMDMYNRLNVTDTAAWWVL